MIVPTRAPVAFSSFTKFALPAVVLWVAMSNLGWVPPELCAGTVALGACRALGITQLFGGLLMLSPCTQRTGAIWAAAAFTITGLVALQGAGALAAFGIAAWCGANLALPAEQHGR